MCKCVVVFETTFHVQFGLESLKGFGDHLDRHDPKMVRNDVIKLPRAINEHDGSNDFNFFNLNGWSRPILK